MLNVEVSTTVKAPRQTVFDLYADYAGWPRLFPTISGVRLLRRQGAKQVLAVDHTEGRVVNELVVRPPDVIDLWEDKRRYEARFSNRFEAVPEGTRLTVRGDVYLKGWARLLRPFLGNCVRRQMLRLQLQPVKVAAEAHARRNIDGPSTPSPTPSSFALSTDGFEDHLDRYTGAHGDLTPERRQ